MNPVAFSIGPLTVHWYGLLIVLGAVLAAYVSTFEARRRGEDPEHVWNLLTWTLIFGIIGARLYHVFSDPVGGLGWSYYRENPIDIINFWSGGFRGLGIYGAVIGGALAVVIYWAFYRRGLRRQVARAHALLDSQRELVGDELVHALKAADLSNRGEVAAQKARVAWLQKRLEGVDTEAARKLSAVADVLAERVVLWRWLDIPIPGLLLAQAIGRLGNRINQELYGPPTDLPWGFKINPQFPYQPPLTRQPGVAELDYLANTRFHPTFYYEALWNVLGFLLFMWLGRRFKHRLRDGDIFLFYLIWYPLGRLWVEMFRPDAWVTGIPGLATAQLIALLSIAVGIVALYLRHRNWQPGVAPATAAEED